jgi:hypothetical protein
MSDERLDVRFVARTRQPPSPFCAIGPTVSASEPRYQTGLCRRVAGALPLLVHSSPHHNAPREAVAIDLLFTAICPA